MLRLGIICDLLEENWPSMDLVGEMLLHHLHSDHAPAVSATRVCPHLRRRFQRLPLLRQHRSVTNADRLLNRFWDYPRHLRRREGEFDLFHVCDHSYSQLVHGLPGARTGVFCHDLDTFRCLLEPRREPRPRWFRSMMRRVLEGLQKAAVVFYATTAVRRQIEQHGLLDPSRLVRAPYGIAPEFTTKPEVEGLAIPQGPIPEPQPFLLHVGSCIWRKRIDVLLDVFAAARRRRRELVLVQVGGTWTSSQREQIERLGVGRAVVQLRGLERPAIASLYRRAALVLQPSEAEGFGLPIIEALACGSVVVASDLPVLREVGGHACLYCKVADVPGWVETVGRLLSNPMAAPEPALRLAWAKSYSWETHTRTILEAYQGLT